MPDELEAFRGEPGHNDVRDVAPKFERAVLIFEFDNHTFAIDAAAIDAVVAWREPAPVPQGDAWLLGVLQERGRIVTVIKHPLGRTETCRFTPSRVIVCSTERGLLGLPTTVTKTVDTVAFEQEPIHANSVVSSIGVVTYVDVAELIKSLLG